MADIQETLLRLHTSLQPWSDTPGLDAQTLLAHLLGQSRAWLLAHLDTALSPEQDQAVSAATARIRAGEPLPYIIAHWEFFGLDFELTPEVLIPRPETELLVEAGLKWLKDHPERRWAADVGTGSGCIAVSLAVSLPDLEILATDISRPALQVAARNAGRHAVARRVHLLQTDLLQPSGYKFDLICANLPYIPTSTLRQLDVYRKEPSQALDGGPTGLSQISRLLAGAPGWLASGGLLLAELEASQGDFTCRLARAEIAGAEISVFPDLAGNDRVLSVKMPN